jgi:T5SS/PEP-CTERM-associated repeat protein
MTASRKISVAPTVSYVRGIGLAAFVLAVLSPSASAGITLIDRNSDARAVASVTDDNGMGHGDFPPAKVQTNFLPANLTNSAAITVDGVTATANTTSISSINLDSATDSLNVAGQGVGTGTASTPGRSGGTADAQVIRLNFALSQISYTWSISGQLTGSTITDFLQAQLVNDNTGDAFLSETAGQGSVGHVDLSGSGTLPPGSYRLEIDLHVATNSPAPGNGSADFDFHVQPVGDAGIQWNNPAGGSFQTASNWDPQMVPGSGDTAVFGLQTVYSVDVGTAQTDRLEIRNGDVTFTNANYIVGSLDLVPAGTLLDNAVLTLASGTLGGIHVLIGESAAAQVDVLDGAILNYTGSLQVGGPGHGSMHIENGGHVFSGEGRIGTGVGGGTVGVDGPDALWDSGSLAVGFFGNVGDKPLCERGRTSFE